MEFLKDVFAGRKRLLRQDQVRHVEVPRFKEFATKHLLAACLQDAELMPFLPTLKATDTINKQWLFDVIATIKPGWWQQQIDSAMQRRLEQGSKNHKPQAIEMTAEFQQLIANSKHVPHSQRGKVLGHLISKPL